MEGKAEQMTRPWQRRLDAPHDDIGADQATFADNVGQLQENAGNDGKRHYFLNTVDGGIQNRAPENVGADQPHQQENPEGSDCRQDG